MRVHLKNTKKLFNPDEIKVIKDFINFIQTKLQLNEDVTFTFLEKKLGRIEEYPQ